MKPLRSVSCSEMTLADLIHALELVDKEKALYIPGAVVSFPGKPASYRGYYEDLAFDVSGERATVGEFLQEARAAIGMVYHGYKGGEYRMGPDSRVWLSRYGECSGARIVGVKETSSRAWLEYAIDDYDE